MVSAPKLPPNERITGFLFNLNLARKFSSLRLSIFSRTGVPVTMAFTLFGRCFRASLFTIKTLEAFLASSLVVRPG